MIAPDDRKRFVELATALLVKKESMEMLGEKHKGQIEVGERMSIDPSVAESYLAPGRELLAFMVELKQRYPRVSAYRFRSQLLSLTIDKGNVLGLAIWPEAQIEVIDG